MTALGIDNETSIATNPVDEMVLDMRSAARLRLHMLRLEEDFEFQRQGGQIFYAVDTNIFYLYLDTAENKQRIEYGKVFNDDDEQVSRFLTSVVAHYIFNTLADAECPPLLLMPGHDQEVRRYFDRIISEAAVEPLQRTDLIERMRRFLEYAGEITEESELRRLVESMQYEIRGFLYESREPAERRDRFQRLLRQDAVRRLDNIRGHPSFEKLVKGLKGTPAEFGSEANIRQIVEVAVLRKEWRDRLRLANKRRGLELDATALARLEFLNKHLEDAKIRVVMITGAPTLLDVTEQVPLKQSGTQSFGDRYIRSPLAFLAVPEVIRPTLDMKTRHAEPVQDWLNTYLAEFFPNAAPTIKGLAELVHDGTFRDRLRASAREAYRADPDVSATRKANWRNHTRALVHAHNSASSIAMKEMDGRLGRTFSEESLSGLKRVIAKEIDASWNDFFEIIGRSGFEFIRRDEKKWPYRRTVPPIIFFSNEIMGDFARRAACRSIFDNIEPFGGEGTDSLKAEFERIRAEDNTGYSVAIFMSLLFAYADRIFAARDLAFRGIEILERLRRRDDSRLGPSKITGREAYYLAAALSRPLAASPSALEEVLPLLDKSEAAREIEEKELDVRQANGLRVRAERLFTEVSFCLFDLCTGMEVTADKRATPKHLKELVAHIFEEWRGASKCGDGLVVMITERRLISYGIVTLALLKEVGGDLSAFAEIQSRWHKAISEDYNSCEAREGCPQFSFFNQAAYVYANNHLTRDDKYDGVDALRSDLRRLLSIGPHRIALAPYDERAYQILLG